MHTLRNHIQQKPPKGFGLAEVLCVLALTAIGAAWGMSSWQLGMQKAKVQAAREGFVHSLQWARIQAIQQGVDVRMVRTTDCPGISSQASDWRCGWRVLTLDDKTLAQQSLPEGVAMKHNQGTDKLSINRRGEPGTVGDSFVFRPQNDLRSSVASTVCISAAGRVRWLSGDKCSN
jgi:prepilin-type N-terminal cleavage/methylation domain-containing protein